MMPRARSLLVSATLAALASPAIASRAIAQQEMVRVVVRDSTGRVIPYAAVQAGGGIARTASDSGVALIRAARADSLKLLARRIGFTPWEGWVRPNAAGEYVVQLRPLPQNIDRVTIYERDTPLSRTGFYDRMERVQRGAYSARFWTPEAIELRNPNRTSVLFEGEVLVKVKTMSGKPVLSGRGGTCPMAILVDGQRITGTVEEINTTEGEDEIQEIARQRHVGREQAERIFINQRLSVDELVTSLSVVAVEIYGSIAAAPAELQRNAPARSCGLVAIWTGRRDR